MSWSSYPAFGGSRFVNDSNQLAFNLNQNIAMSPPNINNFQQNSNMAFLSFPPPSVPASFHVFPNGPRFPNTTPANSMNHNGVSTPGFPGNILRPPTPFAQSNLLSPANFPVNPGLTALTSMPPPSISQWSHPNNLAVQQTNAQESLAQNINPWASTNNFQNSAGFSNLANLSGEDIKPWGSDPSVLLRGFGTNNNERTTNGSWNKNSTNISPWASNTNFTGNLQNPFDGMKKNHSQFTQARDSTYNINPWAQPPPNLAGSSFLPNSFQLPQGQGKPMQQNFHGKRNYQQTFNFNRGNNKKFHGDNTGNPQCQGKRFKEYRNFKTEPNASSAGSCDTCDRTFYSQEEFEKHVAEHVKCTHKNCQFEAHPKIVALHKKMQHDTGYADQINKLKNSEEIEKWRAERRRRFPTAENVLKRQAEQAEKEARGEVVETKEFGKFNKKQNTDKKEYRNNRRRNNRRNNRTNRFNTQTTSTVTVTDSGSDSDDDSHITMRSFPGVFAPTYTETCDTPAKKASDPMQNVSSNSEECIDNDTCIVSQCLDESAQAEKGIEENEKSVLEITIVEDNTEGNTSVNPINIGSDDDDDTPIEIPIVKSSCMNDSADDSPVEIPVSKKPLSEIQSSEIIEDKQVSVASTCSKNDKKEQNSSKDVSKAKEHNRQHNNRRNERDNESTVRKSSLLEKLLADDIRHERNVIMQCIRHVVKKNFFGIGSEL